MQSASTLSPEYNQNIHNILHEPDTCLLSFMTAFRHSCILSQGSSVIVTKQQEDQLSDPTPWVLGELSPEIMWPGREAGQSPPSSDEADVWSYTSTPSWSVFHKTIKHVPMFSFHIHPCYPSFVLTDMYSWRHILSHSCKGTVPGSDIKGSEGTTPLIPNLGFVTRSLHFLVVYQEKDG